MPKQADPYASHLPALKTLSNVVPMRRVLEFGMGRYSTRFFLEHPQLKRLVSVESDARWARDFLAPDLEDFDLLFIDDGKTARERRRTIRWALGQAHPPVVIHDAEVPEYADLIQPTNHTLYGDAPPYTAVVW